VGGGVGGGEVIGLETVFFDFGGYAACLSLVWLVGLVGLRS
jgi:hypothetical protein